jgi:multidrug efflux system membrane fusion protein
MIKRYYLPILATLIVTLGIGYYFFHGSSNAPESPAIQTVEVKTILPEKIRIWSEFSGRLQAVDIAEIRPQVSGRITEVRFEDGNFVKAGDVLFVIEPGPYEAAVARAEASLATAKANAHYAKLEVDRAANMVKTQAVAQRIYDERFNSNEAAIASIKSAEAELKQAHIDLDHAYVKAPISGRAGRVELTVGNLVQAGPNAPLLTRIVSYDPIYADFEVDEQTYMRSVRGIANERKMERLIPVELNILGDPNHIYKGYIYTFDNRLDPASGTIRARAKFDNPGGVLVPGMYVTVKLAGEEEEELLVPQQAIASDQSKKYVYLVDANNKVVYREIFLGEEVGNQRQILSGIRPGDRVIVQGLQHVRPDEVVHMEEAPKK